MGPGEIAELLRSENVRQVHFTFKGVLYGPVGYGRVAQAIVDQRIRVEPLTGSGPSAMYAFRQTDRRAHDTLYVRRDLTPSRPTGLALLVHEGTHAIQDMRAVPMRLLDAEVAAFSAQALYMASRGMTWMAFARAWRELQGEPLEKPQLDAIVTAADAVARWVRERSGAPTVPDDLARRLREAIAAHPTYSDRTRHVSALDGLRRRPGPA